MEKAKGNLIFLIALFCAVLLLTASCARNADRQESPVRATQDQKKTEAKAGGVGEEKEGIEASDDENRNVDISVPGVDVKVKGDDKDKDVKVNIPGAKIEVSGKDDNGEVVISNEDGKAVIKVKGEEKEYQFNGKEGSYHQKVTESAKESDFAVGFYPGAEVSQGMIQNMDSGGGKFQNKSAILKTDDSIEKVKQFYLDSVDETNVLSVEDQTVISVGSPDETETYVTIAISKDKEEGKTTIIITQIEKSDN